jgi:hypothetical protein
MLHSNSAGI